MIRTNGIQLAAKCTNASSLIAASGFFELFYRWSRVRCSTSQRNVSTSIHIKKPQRTAQQECLSLHRLQTRNFSQSSRIDEPPLSTSLRTLMRGLPHSVVVLTTTTANTESPRGITATTSSPKNIPTTPSHQCRGMTLSSFTTLTLTPSPVITFNIKRPSRTLDALYQSRHFLIHVLEASESGARVAERFTRGNKGGNVFLGKDDFEVGGLVVQNEGMGGEGRGDVVLPRLRAEGVVSVLRCEILGNGNQDMEKNENGRSGLVSVGDHVLVLGKVHEILGAEEGNGEGKHGLCYADGRYRRIGDVIEVEEKGY